MINKCVWVKVLVILLAAVSSTWGQYRVGVGRADCTGPAAEIAFMGYGKSSQKGCGIHLRQFSRAFIFDDGTKRAVFVSVDAGMMAHGVHYAVLAQLRKLYQDTYTQENVILSGTHTHNAPGGYLMYFLYDIPTLGFVRQTFDALVAGITRSIVRAHENMLEAEIFLSSGELLEANINRSPTAYLLNPEEERDKYPYNVDKEMVQLKIVESVNRTLIGAINWFAVHPTSMNYTSCFISSDNVGYAALLLEKHLNKNSLTGKGRFVGAFASTNLGDVSPNTRGPRCVTTGKECDLVSSTCDGQAKYCVAAGPGKDMFESTQIIATKLSNKAKTLLDTPDAKKLTGPVNYVQQFVDMPEERASINLPNGTVLQVHGCRPAMGYSFAAGTTDGYGEFNFAQGTKSSSIYWNTVRDLLFPPTKEDIDCHHPKPILINSGRISTPWEWQPSIVSVQLIRLGEVILIAVPGEFTTMSGRRLRKAVTEAAVESGGPAGTKAIVTGLSNVYTSYITTFEEYQIQRYEGASTIYGPHTLALYLKRYKDLTKAMFQGEHPDSGPTPPDLSNKVHNFVPGVLFDTAGLMHRFGDCLQHPPSKVKRGTTVSAKFVAGHPRNDIMQEGSFLRVEKLIGGDEWSVAATDADWDTKFIWKRTSTLIGGSEVTIQWEIPLDTPPGTYRIRHFGHYKQFLGGIHPYSGDTPSFQVED
jgi:neutral ceramidase